MDLQEHLYDIILSLAHSSNKQCPLLPVIFGKVKLCFTKEFGLSPRQMKKAVPAIGGPRLEIKYFKFSIFPVGVQKVILVLTRFFVTLNFRFQIHVNLIDG